MSNGYGEEGTIFAICEKEALLRQALEAKQLERQAELIGQHLEKYLDRKLASSHCEPAHLMEIRRLRALCIEAADLLTIFRVNSDRLHRPWEHGGVDLVTRLLEAGKPHKTEIEIDPGFGDGTHIQWLVVHSSETPETRLVHISCEHTDSLGRRVRDMDQGVTFEAKHLAKVIEALTLIQEGKGSTST